MLLLIHTALGLKQQIFRASRLTHTGGIKSRGLFTAPDHHAAVLSDGTDGCVGDAGPRSQKQTSGGRHGDWDPAILSDGYDGLVILLDDGVFQIDIRNTVPQLREFLQILHSRFTIIMPKP